MQRVIIKMKKVGYASYQLFGPKDNPISQQYHGQPHAAREWAKIWVSSWSDWVVDYSECFDKNEMKEEDNIPTIRTFVL